MKVFDIISNYGIGQTHSVVAENMGEAERIFIGKYPTTTIKEIRLHSNYVQIQTYDEQKKRDGDNE
jgi:hypothetical protein